ncbi:MAG: S8 family peptidase [Solirubrobacteraceae bacterium]
MTSLVAGRRRLRPTHLRVSTLAIALVAAGAFGWLLIVSPASHWSQSGASPVSTVIPPAVGSHAHDGISAPLARLAAAHPDRRVEVIVSLTAGTTPAQGHALVNSLGGRVGLDLHIIHGFSARLSAGAARRLGQSPLVHAVSLNATLRQTDVNPVIAGEGTSLATTFDQTIGATRLWRHSTGQGVGVAVIDTGIAGDQPDFQTSPSDSTSRVIASAVIDPGATSASDSYGHGTAVAGLIAGNGGDRNFSDPQYGRYKGAAPGANLISIKVADEQGHATTLDAIYGLQFAVDHRAQYNIRVVNMSFRSTTAQSYTSDPLDAAAEQAWFSGITVVAAAGNMGSAPDAVDYAPGNDPYVLTVGATDEQGTANPTDDTTASWSSQGTTQDGVAKPDVLAPGAHIITTLAPNSAFSQLCPTCVVDGAYFQVSGTSLAAPLVAGIAADLLAAHPDWTPAMVKGAIVNTATPLPDGGSEVNGRAAYWAEDSQLRSDQNVTPSSLIDPTTGTIDYNTASWSAAGFGPATDPLTASWSTASWSCESCSAPSGGSVDPTTASWSTVGWTTMWG